MKDQIVYTVRNLRTGIEHTVTANHFALDDPEFEVVETPPAEQKKTPVKKPAAKAGNK